MGDDPSPELPDCPPGEKGDCCCCAGTENGLLFDDILREGEEGNDRPLLDDNPCPLPASGLAARWLSWLFNDVPDVPLEDGQFPDGCFGG